ncbi:hypothetical protein GLOIN_2v1660025 [Rhizophagus irregularis DAOM 181602=DAOM 197198]|uniref:Uncharacterized protein n=1 Tax=Rhizophagus irregularis (strain DAOM 181602 / DAOM 197198 / MUCL 43194) TaxID=747089 RepID=A0A2P4PL95_RHIID|nr:hypothetical protein GLOIN_2v1660025 [Rhizophagus irregularis DAOM 181602=DAOM 197198]POG66164.1 hypothetical protein GLOIN_2v1660025 [Rhizophagus irregularis DAOM 181602=DAOM 197198]|eukprot:XP_025173030.1 hypothetical protein GLOIN_2v1660025 [Rhizophagus irregularis DAOM 181602=DAOM 197198]
MENQKQFSFKPISKNETFLLSYDEMQDKLSELDSVSFSRARKRRESAAIFDRLNEDINNSLNNETRRNASTLQKRSNQGLASTDNTNDESLLIEQRARTTLNQFKEVMSKFKMTNVNAQPLPVKSASKPELVANLSHIKCPDDVVCLVNHHLYSPIGIHRTYPAQEIKIREQLNIDVNDNDSPLREHATKEFDQSRLFTRYEKRELSIQKNEITKVSMDFQQPVLLGNISRESTIDKGMILRCENKFSLDSLIHSQKPENNSKNKGMTSKALYKSVSISNNEKQRNMKPNNESSTENLDERNEFRKRKNEKPLSPHLSYINDSSKIVYIIKFGNLKSIILHFPFVSDKIQAISGISTAAKKVKKTQPSNLRAPTSISRLKKKVGSLNSSNMDGFKASTNSQLRRTSNTKQWK